MCLPLSHPARTVRGYLYAMQLCFIVELRALRDICSVISARVYVRIDFRHEEGKFCYFRSNVFINFLRVLAINQFSCTKLTSTYAYH